MAPEARCDAVRMIDADGNERLVRLSTLPFAQWCKAIGIPERNSDAYEAALSAASGVRVPRKPDPPLGGERANRAARRAWQAAMRPWYRVEKRALAALRQLHAIEQQNAEQQNAERAAAHITQNNEPHDAAQLEGGRS